MSVATIQLQSHVNSTLLLLLLLLPLFGAGQATLISSKDPSLQTHSFP
jgi:hypothetical protein